MNSHIAGSGKCFHNLPMPRMTAFISLLFFTVIFIPTHALAELTTEGVLAKLPISDSEREDVFKGEVVDWTTRWDTSSRELSVGGVMWAPNISPEQAMKNWHKDAPYKVIPIVKALHEIKGDGTIDDFKDLRLEPNGEDEAQRYLAAEGGDTLNLSPEEIALFQDLNKHVQQGGKTQESVEKLLRQILFARYQDYRTKGLNGIAPYDRDGELFDPGKELVKTVKSQQYIREKVPALTQYLLQYPGAKPANVVERFLWVNLEVFDRPTFALSHRILYPSGKAYVWVDRHFYTSHDYNVLQSLGVALPAKGRNSGGLYLPGINGLCGWVRVLSQATCRQETHGNPGRGFVQRNPQPDGKKLTLWVSNS